MGLGYLEGLLGASMQPRPAGSLRLFNFVPDEEWYMDIPFTDRRMEIVEARGSNQVLQTDQ